MIHKNFKLASTHCLLFLTLFVICFLPLCINAVVLANDSDSIEDSLMVSDELILMFDESVTLSQQKELIEEIAPLSTILDLEEDFILIQIPEGTDLTILMNQFNDSPLVTCAEPNYLVSSMSLTNDTYSSSQWSLKNTGSYRSYAGTTSKTVKSTKGVDLNIESAWSLYNKKSYAQKEVIVAIIDTGIDITHEDLAANIWTNSGEIAGDGIDNDDNGYIDDINGWDFYNDDNTVCHYKYDSSTKTYSSDPKDDDDHGTHVAGIIGAVGNNKTGIAGVASNINIKLMPLKIEGGSNGSGTIANAIKAIKYATKMGAKVCNISWGSSIYSASLEQVIKESDMLFIAAAGNSGTNNNSTPVYPASYDLDNVISVTFVNSKGKLNALSNYGSKSVDLAAPGVDILSTTVGDSYASMSGSSMAVPQVSGIAAMLYAYSDHLYPKNIREIIENNLTYLEDCDGEIIHGGIPDAYAIVSSLSSIKKDTKSPSIKCSTSCDKTSIIVTVDASDSGGSGIRVIKYLYGKQSLSAFENGTVGTSITDGTATLTKGGTYTFYVSDYAGNETRLVYEVTADSTAPTVKLSYSVASSYKKSTITATIKDSGSGIKTVRYMKGNKTADDFKSSSSGTTVKEKNKKYSFKVSGTGVYTVYAVDYQGNKTIKTINVKIIKAESIRLSTKNKSLYIGNTYTLTPKITPENTTDTITYSSSKESVATVSSSGVITAIKKGKAVITVTTASGKTASITINVIPAS